jgi:hypothetical protein
LLFFKSILFYLVILPKFVLGPLLILYRLYIKKKGIENDFLSRLLKSLRCRLARRFSGRGSLSLLKEALGQEYAGIRDRFLALLPREELKSVPQLAAAFREAHPDAWDLLAAREAETCGRASFFPAGQCGFFRELLRELERENLVIQVQEEREARWKGTL